MAIGLKVVPGKTDTTKPDWSWPNVSPCLSVLCSVGVTLAVTDSDVSSALDFPCLKVSKPHKQKWTIHFPDMREYPQKAYSKLYASIYKQWMGRVSPSILGCFGRTLQTLRSRSKSSDSTRPTPRRLRSVMRFRKEDFPAFAAPTT